MIARTSVVGICLVRQSYYHHGRFWHKVDITIVRSHVRFRGKGRRWSDILILNLPSF